MPKRAREIISRFVKILFFTSRFRIGGKAIGLWVVMIRLRNQTTGIEHFQFRELDTNARVFDRSHFICCFWFWCLQGLIRSATVLARVRMFVLDGRKRSRKECLSIAVNVSPYPCDKEKEWNFDCNHLSVGCMTRKRIFGPDLVVRSTEHTDDQWSSLKREDDKELDHYPAW